MNNMYAIEVFEASEAMVETVWDYVNSVICECEVNGTIIYVDPSDVGKAVEAINELGFTTDEDELEDDDYKDEYVED